MKANGLKQVTDGKFSFAGRISLLRSLFRDRTPGGAHTYAGQECERVPYSADHYRDVFDEYPADNEIPRRLLVPV